MLLNVANFVASLKDFPSSTKASKTSYALLRKLPCLLLGFYRKRRRFGLGYTTHRLFMIKSEYLICYDKAISEKLIHTHVSQIKEFATLANNENIKRVISLRNAAISKIPVHSSKGIMEVVIASTERRVHILFESADEAEMWFSMLQGSRVTVHLEDFDILGELGQGSFGRVELVRYNGDGKLYALKTVHIKSDYGAQLSQFVEERTIMQKMTLCPFIVQLQMAFREESDLYYVMEYCARGDLLARIKAIGALPFEEVRDISASLVTAVGYMHQSHLLHRDIKPENVLLSDRGVAKLADFGLSKTLTSMRSRAFSFCGTDLYRPPEMSAQAIGHTRALDWWQVGCVIYEMLVGVPPFDGTKEERRLKVLKEEPIYPTTLPAETVDLLRALLKKNAWERLGAGDNDSEDVLRHPFFTDVDWEDLKRRASGSNDTSPVGTPSPVRPESDDRKQKVAVLIDESELMGFEYDERVAMDLYDKLSSYLELGCNINVATDFSSFSAFRYNCFLH